MELSWRDRARKADGNILNGGELFLYNDSRPHHREEAVGGDHGSGGNGVAGNGIYVGKLSRRFANRAGETEFSAFEGEFLTLYDVNEDEADYRHEKEGQLICDVGAFLGQHARNDVAGVVLFNKEHSVEEGSEGVDYTVGYGEENGDKAVSVFLVDFFALQKTVLFFVFAFKHRKQNDTGHDKANGNDLKGRQLVPEEEIAHDGRHGARAVAYGGGNRQHKIAQTDISDYHGKNIHARGGQVGYHVGKFEFRSGEQLYSGMNSHDKTDGDDDFPLGVFFVFVRTHFRKQVGTAPKEDCDKRKYEPHKYYSFAIILKSSAALSFMSER